jgi:hypothetical protein
MSQAEITKRVWGDSIHYFYDGVGIDVCLKKDYSGWHYETGRDTGLPERLLKWSEVCKVAYRDLQHPEELDRMMEEARNAERENTCRPRHTRGIFDFDLSVAAQSGGTGPLDEDY